MEILTDDGLPKEGICITCPLCGSETNLELFHAKTRRMPGLEEIHFSGNCSGCGVRIDYESRNPGRTTPDQIAIIEE